MELSSDIKAAVSSVAGRNWSIRKGVVVPTTSKVTLHNGAVELDAVYLYADLANSTKLAREFPQTTAAKVIRCFLNATCKVIIARGGEIRGFDGDRVMAIFVGITRYAQAAKCALQINNAVTNIVRPTLEKNLPSLRRRKFEVRHCVGIASGKALVVRGGVRRNSDLVSIGRAPNVAAKLSDIRSRPYYSFITLTVFNKLPHDAKYDGADRTPLWDGPLERNVGGEKMKVYRSKLTISL